MELLESVEFLNPHNLKGGATWVTLNKKVIIASKKLWLFVAYQFRVTNLTTNYITRFQQKFWHKKFLIKKYLKNSGNFSYTNNASDRQ